MGPVKKSSANSRRKGYRTDPISIIRKSLNRFQAPEEVAFLTERLFQKDLTVLKDFHEKLQDSDETQKLQMAKTNLLNLIEAALNKKLRNTKHEIVNFPTNPENYVSFCDLTELTLYPDRKLWHTFKLDDESGALETLHDEELPVWEIRKKLKKILKQQEDVLSSVQADVQSFDKGEMMFFRMVSTPILKSKESSEAKLITAHPTYLVYFPGEPYFYAASETPNEAHCKALAQVLKCATYEGIPLSGKDLKSLRQLRVNRDLPEDIDHELWTDSEEPLPVLDTFTVSAVADFMDVDKETVLVKDFRSTLEIHGTDVLNGLRLLCETGMITDPPPSWIRKAVYRGRNLVHIKPKKSERIQNNRVFSDFADDEMSIAGSDITVIRRKSK